VKPQHPAVNIDDLRSILASAQRDSQRLPAFATLIFHDDACWADIIAGLDQSPALAETAAVYLHAQLDVPHRGMPILDKSAWLSLLTQSGRSPSDKVRAASPPAPSLWQRIRRAMTRRAEK
jgi:hypothetical protein